MSVKRSRKARASASPLQDELDDVRAELEGRILSKEIVRVMHRVRDHLISVHSIPALGVGDHAPEFDLSSSDGRRVSSSELLRSGPLVLTFYRGSWCPYCVYDLEALQAALPELTARGASVAAVSQQIIAPGRQCCAIGELDFPLLFDRSGELAAQFGVRWTVPPDLQRVYKLLDADLEVLNGEDSWTLSMPARFVLDRDGIIAYAATSPDYTIRSKPADLLSVLDWLRCKVLVDEAP